VSIKIGEALTDPPYGLDLRTFVPVFRAARDFLRAAAAGFLALVATGFLALAAAGFLVLAAAGFLVLAATGFLALAAAGFLVLAATGFLALVAAGFLALATASTGAGNSGCGGFGVRWWPWCSGWMRAASSSVRSSVSARFRRSSSRYSGIVLVVMAVVWQNCPRPRCPILATR